MAQKTPVKKTGVKKAPAKKVETKSEVFIRLAEPRVLKVLRAFRILGNCSNRSNYEYTQEQVNKIFDSIGNSYELLVSKFTASKEQQEKFNL